jgi:RNA polymerase sigma-70 factor (ECF subfamily)
VTASGGPDAGEADDSELLAAAARRNAAAFGKIVSRHYRAVYRLVWRMTGGHSDSEDIAQEAFIKLWQNPAQIRDAGALKGWLMRVAANGAIDRLRKRQTSELEAAAEVADAAPLAEAGLARQGAAGRVDRMIAQLPDRQRLALSLVYFEGLSNIEAARAMETSVEAVESLLSRARRSLKEAMAGEWRELLEGLSGAGE